MVRQMKDSGVQWIGKIPNSWSILPLRNCFKERNDRVSDYDWEPLSVTKQGILKQLESAAKSDAHDDRKKVCKNDFVINSRSDRKQSCGISHYDGSVSLINIVLESRTLKTEYVKYLLNNYGFAEEFYRWGTGIVSDLWSTKWERMKKIMLPIPDDKEQQQIAKFLDYKVVEIDKSINKTKQTIEDYKKYKQALITEAVTKGLNPDVEMKDSGIEWIGQIPKHWDISKIKYVAIFNPNCDTSKLTPNSIITYTPMEYIKNGYYVKNTSEYSKVSTSLTRYEEEDIVMAKVTPCFENGNIAIMSDLASGFGLGSSELFVFRATEVDVKYLFYWLRNKLFMEQACSTMTGTGGLKRVSGQFVKDSNIVFPSEKEQREIVKYLDKKCAEIDNLIAKKEALVIDLEEYKKSLIYEYVTGKKEVITSKIIPFPASVNCKDKRFSQAILLTKILDEFGEYHFGRVKVAKTLYVIENHIGFDFDTDTIRKVAGPLDEKFYKAEAIVRHNQWFDVLEQKDTIRYFAGKEKTKYLEYYNRYFKDYNVEIQRIINIFKDLNMNEAELLATAYASWNDAIIKGNRFSEDELIEDIFSWHDSKKRFSKEKWMQTFEELKQKNIVPVGHGKMTIQDKE